MRRIPSPMTFDFIKSNSATDGTCLIWRRAVDARGIPTISEGGKTYSIRRWTYRWKNLDIPAGFCIIDICGRRDCVNPDHLHAAPSPPPPSQAKDVKERLAANTTRRGTCLEFVTASQHWFGYGLVWYEGRSQAAHRVSYMLRHGPIPDGAVIRHRCDNPPCINPDHLVCGTQKDNMRDRFERGRANTARGSKIGSAKLTEWQVAEIRTRLALGVARRELARRYGVQGDAIGAIARNENWRHVKPVDPSELTPWQ